MAGENDKGTGLKGSLDAMVQQLGAMNAHNAAMLKAQEENTDAVKESGTGKGGRKNLLSAAKAIPVVGRAVVKGSEMITAAINQTIKLQEQAQGRGLNLANHTAMLAQSTTSMTEGLVGYGDQLGASVEQFNSGMRNGTEATRKLAMYTQLTGGSSKKMLKDLRKVTAGLGISTEQEAVLSNHIMGLSKTFNMTTEELSSAMNGLASNMTVLKTIGISDEIAAATASMAGILGPGMEKTASDFVNGLLGAGGDIKASMLGITDIRQKLLRGEGNTTELLMEAMSKVGNTINTQMDAVNAAGTGIQVATTNYAEIYGQEMMGAALGMKDLNAISRRTGKSLADMISDAANASANADLQITSVGNLFSTSFSWLTKIITGLGEKIFGFMTEFPKLGKVLVNVAAAIAAAAAVIGGKALLGGGGAAGKGAGKGAAGLGKGMGKGLIGLGRGLKAIGSPAAMKGAVTIGILAASVGIAAIGFMQFASVGWQDIGKGLVVLAALTAIAVVMGKVAGQIIPGAGAIVLLGLSLLPLAYSFNLIKDVGISTMYHFAGALTVLALAAAGASFIAPFIALGAGAFALLGLALIPLAAALTLAVPGLDAITVSLFALSQVPIANLLLIGPALLGMAAGFVALSGGGLLSNVLDGLGSLFGGDSPVEKLVKMGEAAKHINKLEAALWGLPAALGAFEGAIDNMSSDPFEKLSNGMEKFQGKFAWGGKITRGQVTQASMQEGDAGKALHNERIDLQRMKQALRNAEAQNNDAAADEWRDSIEMQRMQVQILETINENLAIANGQRANPKDKTRPMAGNVTSNNAL